VAVERDLFRRLPGPRDGELFLRERPLSVDDEGNPIDLQNIPEQQLDIGLGEKAVGVRMRFSMWSIICWRCSAGAPPSYRV